MKILYEFDDMADNQKKYKEEVKKIKEKVKHRPLLFEQCNLLNEAYKRDFRIEKMKQLYEYREMLKANKVTNLRGKDIIRNFF